MFGRESQSQADKGADEDGGDQAGNKGKRSGSLSRKKRIAEPEHVERPNSNPYTRYEDLDSLRDAARKSKILGSRSAKPKLTTPKTTTDVPHRFEKATEVGAGKPSLSAPNEFILGGEGLGASDKDGHGVVPAQVVSSKRSRFNNGNLSSHCSWQKEVISRFDVTKGAGGEKGAGKSTGGEELPKTFSLKGKNLLELGSN